MIYRPLVTIICILFFVPQVFGQVTTVVEGRPSFRVQQFGASMSDERLSSSDATTYKVVISKIGNNYYWASRRNTPLARVDDGGAFLTFIALGGEGYVRLIKSNFREWASGNYMGADEFDYFEHVVTKFGSTTYYGKVIPD